MYWIARMIQPVKQAGIGLLILCLVAGVYAARSDQAANAVPPSHPSVIFNGKDLSGWTQVPAHSWIVKNGAMTSLGVGRGMIYSAKNYSRYRLTFVARQISGNHAACFLIFCTRPKPGKKPLDALAGIQFQIPTGDHWDYRKGHNNSGRGEFHKLRHRKFNSHKWYRVDVRVNAAAGTARVYVAQPINSKPVEVAKFKNKAAGRVGPIAFQMHNEKLFDQYKDVTIEEYPNSPARSQKP